MIKVYIIALLLFVTSIGAQDTLTVVAIGEAELEADKIAFMMPETSKLTAAEIKKVKEMLKIFKSDFDFYREIFEVNKETLVNVDKKAARYIVENSIVAEGNLTKLLSKVHDTKENKVIFENKVKINFANIRSFSHKVADSIYRSITGKKSIFETKILFVSDRTSRGSDLQKELYIMDFDGARKERLTFLRSMIISPSLSQDNSKVLYTLVEAKWRKATSGDGVQKVKNLNLYMMDLKTKKKTLISSIDGINSGGVFNKTGDSIYLTLSYQRNADIYKMNLKTKKRTRITKHFSDDVDPHINANETLMTMLSGRPGKAMIYTLDPTGLEKKVKRISFVGKFNAAPRFNPEGTEIVFSSWVDERFDIYRINSDGRNLVRLTKNFGSNEEPWFSPDGQFIVFTSQRVITRKKAVQDVYIMNRNGEIIRKISSGYGKISTPRWSN